MDELSTYSTCATVNVFECELSVSVCNKFGTPLVIGRTVPIFGAIHFTVYNTYRELEWRLG
jgi:hypothetical protein